MTLWQASNQVMKALIRCGAGAAKTHAAVQQVAAVCGRGGVPARQSAGEVTGMSLIPGGPPNLARSLNSQPAISCNASSGAEKSQLCGCVETSTVVESVCKRHLHVVRKFHVIFNKILAPSYHKLLNFHSFLSDQRHKRSSE